MLVAGFVLLSLGSPALCQITKVQVGFCAKTISSGVAPFAVATRLGWFKEDGIEVTLVPLAGSSDCVKSVTTSRSHSPWLPSSPRLWPTFRESRPRPSIPPIRATFTSSLCLRTVRFNKSGILRGR